MSDLVAGPALSDGRTRQPETRLRLAALVPNSRREPFLSALLATTGLLLLMRFGPAPGDAPAHLYRTFLVQHHVLLWDNLWYGGQYPLASYSLLYYLPAALVGNMPLVFVAAVAAAYLFSSTVVSEWGSLASWPSRLFGVLAAAPFYTGLYSYSVGFATLLGAVRALQRGHVWLVVVLAAVTVALSPLAFAFLCALLLAVALSKRRNTRTTVRTVAALGVISAIEGLVLIVFPSTGNYPFHLVNLAGLLLFCGFGVACARRGPQTQLLALFYLVWGLGSVIAYAIPSPIGGNWSRLDAFAIPLMLMTVKLAGFRPRWLTTLGLLTAVAFNLIPYALLIPLRLDNRPAKAAFWAPTLSYLRHHNPADFRVEVVPTAAHWEAYWLPRAGVAIARGWYRQLDVSANPVLYRATLRPDSYRAWLRRMGVRYAVLPATALDPDGGSAEANLLRTGAAGLKPVFRDSSATIYELPNPTPLLTGNAPAAITSDGHQSIQGTVAATGRYLLRFRYTPYWTITRSAGCVARRKDGLTELVLNRAGAFTITIAQEPGQIVSSAFSSTGTCR